MLTLIPLEALNHLPFPAFVFGLIALGLLLAGLTFVLSVGASRPHS